MVEILTQQSPHNLGALSEYAKRSQGSPNSKKILILILYLGYNDMVKKTISRYCPFKRCFSPMFLVRKILLLIIPLPVKMRSEVKFQFFTRSSVLESGI
jgi:hypothetical protein